MKDFMRSNPEERAPTERTMIDFMRMNLEFLR